MIKITLLPTTDSAPLEHIGQNAGICWNSPTNDPEKNIKRAKSCITSGHGRVLEYVNVEFVLEGASARMMRELYTHIAGGPTRLQSSTRYVNSDNFAYFTPPTITKNSEALAEYTIIMNSIASAYKKLTDMGVPVEDAANILPLGMESKMVMKCNLRMLISMMNQRLCSRAYHEYRTVMHELKNQLGELNEQWKWIVVTYFVPKCEVCGFCTEAKCCGRKPTKSEYDKLLYFANHPRKE